MTLWATHKNGIKTELALAGVAGLGGDLLETVQETQNDEEEQALPGSQVNFAVQCSTCTSLVGISKHAAAVINLYNNVHKLVNDFNCPMVALTSL